jgi:hypothetical protein
MTPPGALLGRSYITSHSFDIGLAGQFVPCRPAVVPLQTAAARGAARHGVSRRPAARTRPQHQCLVNMSMICCFSLDDTSGGVIPAGPTPPMASLAPASGLAESRPMLATKPLPGVISG